MDECLKKILAAEAAVFFLDFDGTLVGLQPRPEAAFLHPKKKKLLAELARKTHLAFVSGRSLAELESLVAVDHAGYIGNHGLEIRCRGKVWVHRRAVFFEPALRAFLEMIAEKSSHIDGVFIENKGLTGTIHFRLTPGRQVRELRRLIRGEMKKYERALRLVPGKMVLEVRPQVEWNKGHGIVKYLSCLGIPGPVSKVYIGDDQTDEDAFRILSPRDIGIAVGNRKKTIAKFRRRDVPGVWNLLRSLNSLL